MSEKWCRHKANRLLGLIKRSFNFLEPQMLCNCTNMTSLGLRMCYLESVQLGDISVLERIQRNITRACPANT